MAVSFPRLPRWLCGGNTKEREKKESIPKGSCSLNHSPKKTKSASSSSSVKKIKRGWIGRGGSGEEEKMGNVVFPEPDDPEWSIGWVEPHGPGFKNEDDSGGFVVLVPCYKKVMNGLGNQIPHGFLSPAPAPDDLNDLQVESLEIFIAENSGYYHNCLEFGCLGSDETKTADGKTMEQWLSSMGKL